MGWFFWLKPEIAVLQAQADDNSAMAEIHAESFPRAWTEDEIATLLDGPGVTAWVAKPEGQGGAAPCGVLILRETPGEAEIITVATSPSRRRSGAGRALMLAAIRHCRSNRVGRLLLEVSENNFPAVSLYKSLGFRQIGLRKGYYGSQAQGSAAPAALVMELQLD